MLPRRNPRQGFTLLESLLAFVLLAMVIGGAYLAIAQTAARQARLGEDLDMARLARALLTEYTVTHPAMQKTGELPPRYRWTITEEALPVEEAAGLRLAATRVRVTITPASGKPFTMATAMTKALP